MNRQSQTKIATNSPLIVVGMPRCGSTIFTRLLNESPDLLMINDCYYLQYVDAINGFSNNDYATKVKLVEYLEELLIRRIKRPESTGIGCGLMISNEQEAKIKEFLRNFDANQQEDWVSILTDIMSFSADTAGNKIWGHNTPQDYLNLDLIESKFPHSKFIFMIRNPISMLGSYKFILKEEEYNNDNLRYHPVLQTLAWRTSVRAFLDYKKRHPDRILLVRYEDLVADTKKTLSQVASFLDVNFPPLDVSDFSNNSSFQGKKRQTITDTAMWICEKIAGQEMQQLEYNLLGKKPRIKDLGNLLAVSLRVTRYYLFNLITSSDIRKRVLKLAQKSIK
jgi:hypothetical protein